MNAQQWREIIWNNTYKFKDNSLRIKTEGEFKMGFGPVGTIRKQVMRQMKAKKKAENNIFNASLPNIKIPKSYSIKVPKSKIKF